MPCNIEFIGVHFDESFSKIISPDNDETPSDNGDSNYESAISMLEFSGDEELYLFEKVALKIVNIKTPILDCLKFEPLSCLPWENYTIPKINLQEQFENSLKLKRLISQFDINRHSFEYSNELRFLSENVERQFSQKQGCISLKSQLPDCGKFLEFEAKLIFKNEEYSTVVSMNNKYKDLLLIFDFDTFEQAEEFAKKIGIVKPTYTNSRKMAKSSFYSNQIRNDGPRQYSHEQVYAQKRSAVMRHKFSPCYRKMNDPESLTVCVQINDPKIINLWDPLFNIELLKSCL